MEITIHLHYIIVYYNSGVTFFPFCFLFAYNKLIRLRVILDKIKTKLCDNWRHHNDK